MTQVLKQNGSMPIISVSVVAGYLREVRGTVHLVELHRFCGEKHAHDGGEMKAHTLAEQVMREIEGAVLVINKESEHLPASDVNYWPIHARAGRYEI